LDNRFREDADGDRDGDASGIEMQVTEILLFHA
jgi:hypothetical protein